jgi:hypothetical protein
MGYDFKGWQSSGTATSNLLYLTALFGGNPVPPDILYILKPILEKSKFIDGYNL